jgi:hypothetical protein
MLAKIDHVTSEENYVVSENKTQELTRNLPKYIY